MCVIRIFHWWNFANYVGVLCLFVCSCVCIRTFHHYGTKIVILVFSINVKVYYTLTHTHQRNIVNFHSEKFFSVPSRSFFYLFSYWICQPTGRSWATISVDFFSMEFFFFFYYYYSTQSIWYISWLVWQFVYSIWHLNFILFYFNSTFQLSSYFIVFYIVYLWHAKIIVEKNTVNVDMIHLWFCTVFWWWW